MLWKLPLLLLLSLMIPAPSSATDGERIDPDLEVKRLARGVWLHTSWHELEGFGRVPANGLVVVSDGEAALVDTPWTDAQTRALAAWVRRRLEATVTAVVPTHYHADCMGGLGAAHALGARSYALDTTVAFARRDRLPVPHESFKDEHSLLVGSRRLELRFFGPGHTVDNIVVWVPEARILFGGDIVRSAGARSLGYTKEADLGAWPSSIEALGHHYAGAALIVPGHGPPGGAELLAHTRGLLAAPR